MEEIIEYKYKFEQRAYNEDSNEEEIQAIKNQVYALDDEIIFIKELPIVSIFSINLVFAEIEKLGQQMEEYGILIDIRETAKPDTQTRRAINTGFSKICESTEHVSFCTGQNIIVNTAARFVMYQTNLNSFSIHKTIKASVQAIKMKLHG